MASWNVYLLGVVQVHFGEWRITHFESTRVIALLARLALFPERIHPREELVELLWPEVDPDVGRNRLRSALSSLRRALELPGTTGDLFLVDRHSLRLNPQAFTCDAVELTRAIGQKRWREARELHRGELLPGFYDDWILTERERLEALCESLPEPQEVPEPPVRLPRTLLLPAYLTTFFGRETEIAALATLLRQHRLVTLTGSGGMGKTRLSVEVARAVAPSVDRCAFVALAECHEPGELLTRVRSALGLQGDTPIFEALAEQTVLLVLDNLEQLLDQEASTVVEELLLRLPQLTCLVTSRRGLGIEGEREWPLAPLPLPTDEEPMSAALALFVDRARAVRPDFSLTVKNRDDLLDLGIHLEGIPLAIELVASRIRAYSLSELAAQLSSHFSSVTHARIRGHKDERHRSLHATVAWSWRLLSPQLQRFLAALSIFRGGWSAEAAEAVCEEPDAHGLLEELAADSLVVVSERPDGSVRFRLLEMIRSFVEERLAPDRRAELAEAHGSYFLVWQETRGSRWHEMHDETQNLCAALEQALSTGNARRAFALLKPVWTLLGLRRGEESLSLIQRALDIPETTSYQRCMGLLEQYFLLMTLGNWNDAAISLETAEKEIEEDKKRELFVLRAQAYNLVKHQANQKEVIPLLEKALTLSLSLKDREAEAFLLNLRGGIALRQEKDFDLAESVYAKSEEIYLSREDITNANQILLNRANAAIESGNFEKASDLYETCRKNCRKIGDDLLETYVDNGMGSVCVKKKQWAEAEFYLLNCIRQAWKLGDRYILGYALWNLSEPLLYKNNFEISAQLMGFSELFWTSNFTQLTDEDDEYRESIRRRCFEKIGAARTWLLWKKGSALSLRDAVTLALSQTAKTS